MRLSIFGLISVVLCATASPSAANVVISNAATANMTCSAGICAPTAAEAVLNVQDLAAMLASGNATVTTTGAGVQAKNIVLDARLEWSTNGGLTLDAFQSVRLNRLLNVNGASAVSIVTNDGGSNGAFWCGDKGRLQFKNLSGTLTINGSAYTLVSNVAGLATAIAANPSGGFALANNYDASADGTYSAAPVPTVFTGTFNGLGNAISNLSINDPVQDSSVGLFAETTTGSTIANIRLSNANVQGGPGQTAEFVGGVVGYAAGGVVAHSFTSGTVSGMGVAIVGGLVGFGSGVSSSESAANVSATDSGSAAGGLVGLSQYGSVEDSGATGNVSGNAFAGGLIGFSYTGSVKHSWASGAVTGASGYTGGLTGMNYAGPIDRSSATGPVTCQTTCGGLVGMNNGGPGSSNAIISESFATGSVSADVNAYTTVGGLVGLNQFGEISNSYATGAVSAKIVGGLVGLNESDSGNPSILRSYATGAVDGTSSNAGGVIGNDELPSTNKHAYWDITTSGINDPGQGAGNVSDDPGLRGLSDRKLRAALPSGFSSRIWTQNLDLNGGRPYLIANPPTN